LPCFTGAHEKFRKVLDCGSPLPLLRRQSCRGKSGRGLPQSKTLARQPIYPIQLAGYGIFETPLNLIPILPRLRIFA
jgi:hypothetical protein